MTGGATTYPSYTNNLDGTITVDACCINLYDNPNFQGNPKPYEFSISTFTVSMNETNYIIANYNNGSPELQNATDVSIITESDIVPILTVYAISNEHIHTLNWDSLGLGLSNKLHQRLVKTNRFALETGLDVTQTTGLQFDISTGTVWYGATKTELDIFHSNNGNLNIVLQDGTEIATDSFVSNYYEHNGALTLLTNNRYAVNWIYRTVESNQAYTLIMLGQGDYKITEARSSTPPPAPQFINTHCKLIAKVIILKDSTEALIQKVGDGDNFSIVTPQYHNELLGLNDGDNYEHLTSIEKDVALNGSLTVDLLANNFTATGTTTLATTTIYGELKLDENHLVYNDNAIDIANVRLPTSNAPSWVDYKSGQVLAFSSSQENIIYFSTQLPHGYKPGENIEFHIHVVYPTGTVATSTWQFTYSWASYDVEAFSTATSTQKLLSSSGVADLHKLHSITTLIGTNKSESSVIICSLRRLGADANDTYTSDIYLISADFHIPIEKLGELDGHF